MSTLWTPGGERPIRRDPSDGPPGRQSGSSEPATEPTSGTGAGRSASVGSGPAAAAAEPTDAELRAQMADLQEQLARTPVEVVVANHAFGLFELAALHLGRRPPALDQARVAIDALAALVEGMAGRLGEAEPQLTDGLAQLRLAFVQIRAATSAGPGPGAAGPDGPARDEG